MTWTSTISNKLLLEAAASSAPQPEYWDFQPDALAPGITDIGRGIAYRAAGIPNTHNMLTDLSARTSLSYVTGSHALKVGYTLLGGKYITRIDKLNEQTFTALNGVPVAVTYYGDPSVASYYVMPNLGIFGQDQWTLNRLTMNLGLRFDYFRSGFDDQTTPATIYVPVARSFPGQVAVDWKDLSPRLGVSYDLFGNGKTALKASVSRYVLQYATTFASTLNPITNNNISTRALIGNPPIGPDNNPIITGNPFNPAANGNLGPATNALFGQPIQTVHYDPSWSSGFGKRPYDWETAVGVQHELARGLSVNASYYRRIYGNFYVTQNQALTPGAFNSYCVTTPADPRLPGGGGQQLCGLYDLNPASVGRVQNTLTAASNFGAVYEHWNGLDFTMNARLSRLLLQGGVSTGKTTVNDCDILTQYPNVVVPGVSGGLISFASSANTSTSTSNTSTPGLSPQFCSVETPFLTQFKLLGSYALPKDIQVAATLQSLPGPMIGAYGSYTSAQIAPSLGRPLGTAATATIDLVAPGVLYGQRLNQVDLRLTKIVKLGRTRFQGMVDLYNALNANPVLVLNNTYGATAGAAAGAAWQLPQGILPGHIIKFGIQANF